MQTATPRPTTGDALPSYCRPPSGVLAGDDAEDLEPVAEVGKDGFETTIGIERARS
jgi:hypothetical protein